MGVSETFRSMTELPADQQLVLAEAALREPYLELQSAAFGALVDPNGLNRPDLVIQHFAELLPDVQRRVTGHPRLFQGAAREEILSASEVFRRAGYEAVAALEGFAGMPLLARGLNDPSVLVRDRVADLLENFGQQYTFHLVAFRLHGDPASREFVERNREPVLRSLGDLLRAYPAHGRKVFLDLAIECDPDTYPLVTDVILARRDVPTFGAFVKALASSATRNAVELLFRLYLEPRTRLRDVAVEVMRLRHDAAFALLVAHTLSKMPPGQVESLARRLRDIPWWGAVEAAPDLDAASAARLIEFVARSGLDREAREAKVLAFLKSPHPEVRLRVLAALRSLGDAVRRDVAVGLLEDPSDDVQLAAAREVVALGVPGRARLLLPFLGHPRTELREIATREVAGASFEQFFRSFDQLDPATRERAARALAKIDGRINERLAEELTSLDGERRFRALRILGYVDVAGDLQALLPALLQDPDRRVRATALKILRLTDSVEGMKRLVEALRDPDARVRANAIEAFEDGGDSRTAPFLVPFLDDPDNRVRAVAAKALHTFGRPEARDALEAMLGDGDERARISAAWAIGETAFEGAADLLQAHARSEESAAVQERLREALRRIEEQGSGELET